MSEEIEAGLFQQFNKVVRWGVGVSVAVILILYVLGVLYGPKDGGFWFAVLTLGLDLAPNLVSSALLFWAGYALFREVQEVKTQKERQSLASSVAGQVVASLNGKLSVPPAPVELYENYRAVPWANILKVASTVDICVHYWDRWLADNEATLLALFDQGGHVRMVLPDPEAEELIRAVKTRFPEYEPDRIKENILATRDRLLQIAADSSSKDATAEVYLSGKLTWYCGVKCDRRTLVLSLYEHARRYVSGSPTIFIDLATCPGAGEWFNREFTDLIEDVQPETLPKEKKGRGA